MGAIDAYLYQQAQSSRGSCAVLGDLAEILGVLQLNVCAKRFIEHFQSFLVAYAVYQSRLLRLFMPRPVRARSR